MKVLRFLLEPYLNVKQLPLTFHGVPLLASQSLAQLWLLNPLLCLLERLPLVLHRARLQRLWRLASTSQQNQNRTCKLTAPRNSSLRLLRVTTALACPCLSQSGVLKLKTPPYPATLGGAIDYGRCDVKLECNINGRCQNIRTKPAPDVRTIQRIHSVTRKPDVAFSVQNSILAHFKCRTWLSVPKLILAHVSKLWKQRWHRDKRWRQRRR
jgi:hypothetical protein